MSWWNTSSISSFATQALKNAQKKIDKVLDIEDEEGTGQTTGGKTFVMYSVIIDMVLFRYDSILNTILIPCSDG